MHLQDPHLITSSTFYNIIILVNHKLSFCSSSRTDTISSTAPQSPPFVTEYTSTTTTPPHVPSTLTSPPATALHAKVDLVQTLNSSHPSDCPPISHTQPQPQSQPHHPSSDKGSRVLRGPSQAVDETQQQLPLLNTISTILPGSMWCR